MRQVNQSVCDRQVAGSSLTRDELWAFDRFKIMPTATENVCCCPYKVGICCISLANNNICFCIRAYSDGSYLKPLNYTGLGKELIIIEYLNQSSRDL